MFLPQQNKLMILGKTIRCCKVRPVFRCHMTLKFPCLERFARHKLLSFYPFRVERELLLGFPSLHQNKPQEKGVQDVVNKFSTIW